mmetsp:Transcript_9879/g.16184  ORF Transcript_9879/g.16184 Transcript_9879/m.16184 type:complete len:317 (+) Transcript_9879:168-1118(+)
MEGSPVVKRVVVGGVETVIVFPPEDGKGDASGGGLEPVAKRICRSPERLNGTKIGKDCENRLESANVVFLLHGRKAKKEKRIAVHALKMAKTGLVCIYSDSPNHGERILDSSINESWKEGNWEHSIDMYSQMITSLREMQVQIDFLPSILNITFTKIGVYGISQGGHAALICMTNEPRIDVCVSIISSGDYYLNMKKRYSALITDTESRDLLEVPEFAELYPDSLAEVVERFDPIKNVERLSKHTRPILMLNGGSDTLVPAECNINLFKALKPYYAEANCPENLNIRMYDGVKHTVTEMMLEESLQFLQKFMSDSQ